MLRSHVLNCYHWILGQRKGSYHCLGKNLKRQKLQGHKGYEQRGEDVVYVSPRLLLDQEISGRLLSSKSMKRENITKKNIVNQNYSLLYII